MCAKEISLRRIKADKPKAAGKVNVTGRVEAISKENIQAEETEEMMAESKYQNVLRLAEAQRGNCAESLSRLVCDEFHV